MGPYQHSGPGRMSERTDSFDTDSQASPSMAVLWGGTKPSTARSRDLQHTFVGHQPVQCRARFFSYPPLGFESLPTFETPLGKQLPIVSPSALEVNCHMRRPQHFHFYLFVHLVLCVKPDKPRRNLQFRATFIRPCVNRFRTLLTRATAGSGGDQSIQDSVFGRRIPAAAR